MDQIYGLFNNAVNSKTLSGNQPCEHELVSKSISTSY
jgi:hypothetical protein